MTTTNFIDKQTVIVADWLNDVDAHTYDQETTAHQATKINFNLNETGSINRTVKEKLGDFVSVKDFGAVGDGVTDDTTAIQTAVNIATQLIFPAGTYIISDSIKPKANQKWVGARGQTTVKVHTAIGAGGVNCIQWNKSTRPASDPALSNFHVEGIIFDANGHECPAQINGLS